MDQILVGTSIEVGVIPSFESRPGLSKALFAAAIGYVLKVKFLHSTMKAVPNPGTGSSSCPMSKIPWPAS